jgi:ribosomal protein L37AE/L43A
MKDPRRASSPNHLVCPLCGSGELLLSARNRAACSSCGDLVGGAMVRTLRQITALPAARGRHACDCDHPEMRRVSDGTFHCPACGLEVSPVDASTPVGEPDPQPGPKSRQGPCKEINQRDEE